MAIVRGLIQRGDQANWDGKTATASRVDATGGTVTGLAIGNEVDVLQVYGAGENRTRGSIASAVQKIGATTASLVLAPGTWTIDDDLTIGSNFTCIVPAGCVFSVASGKTLTINGHVQAGLHQIFSGSGTVAGLGRNIAVYPQWWGAVGDGSTDDSTAFQAAISSIEGTGATVYVSPESSGYVCDSRLTIAGAMRLLIDGTTVTLAPGDAGIASGLLITGSNVTVEGVAGGGVAGSKDLTSNNGNYETILINDSVASVDDVKIINLKARCTVTNSNASPMISVIRFSATNSGRLITNPRVEGCDVQIVAPDVDTAHKWYGIYFFSGISAADNTRSVVGASCESNYLNASSGRSIQLVGVDGGVVSHNRIVDLGDGNQFGTNGIRILGCADIAVGINYVEKNTDAYGGCIYLAGSTGFDTEIWTENCSVTGNVLTDHSTANADTVLYIDGVRNTVISGNVITATKPTTGLANHRGIRVEDNTFADTPNSDIEIRDNRISGFGGTAGFAIRIDANQTSLTIANNSLGSGPNNTNFINDLSGVAVIYGNTYDNVLSMYNSELVTTTNVILASENGKTFFLNLANGFTSTLPAPALGLKFKFIVKLAPTTAYIITTNGGDNLLYGTFIDIVGELEPIIAQDTLTFVANTALIGDYLEVESDGSGWFCKAASGADGGITVAAT